MCFINTDVDLDYQRTNHISVKWSVEDPQSGVVSCLWAIGMLLLYIHSTYSKFVLSGHSKIDKIKVLKEKW